MEFINPKGNIKLYGKEITRIRGIRFFECYYKKKRCYGVQQLSTGFCAVFNHQKKILNNLTELVANGANICRELRGDMNILYNDKKFVSLAKYLFCLYNGVTPNKEAFNNYIRHRVKDKSKPIENCRKENLYLGGVSVSFRKDEQDKECVAVMSNTNSHLDKFEPMQILVDIMTTENFILQWHNNRLICNIKGKVIFPVADLAYIAYYDNTLTINNCIEKLKELKKYKKENRLSIEHLDGDFHNHYKYNIALVDEGLNSQKNDKISRIVEPYFLTVVYDKAYNSGITPNGYFKILIGTFKDDYMIDVEKRFITDNFENVVNLLDIYIKHYPNRIDKEKAKSNERLIFERFFAEMLAKEPNENFISLDTLHLQ